MKKNNNDQNRNLRLTAMQIFGDILFHFCLQCTAHQRLGCSYFNTYGNL